MGTPVRLNDTPPPPLQRIYMTHRFFWTGPVIQRGGNKVGNFLVSLPPLGRYDDRTGLHCLGAGSRLSASIAPAADGRSERHREILEMVTEYGFEDEEWMRLARDTGQLAEALRGIERLKENGRPGPEFGTAATCHPERLDTCLRRFPRSFRKQWIPTPSGRKAGLSWEPTRCDC